MSDKLLENGMFTLPLLASDEKSTKRIKEMAEKSPQKLSLHPGPANKNAELENSVYQWIVEQRESELAVRTVNVIEKALPIHPHFKNNSEGALFSWFYRYLKRNKLPSRTRTRVSQTTAIAMESVCQDFAQRLMTSYSYRIDDPRYLVNMDETAVYMNCSPNHTIHKNGEKAVSIMIGSASFARFTLAVSVAMDGPSCPCLLFSKGNLEEQ